MYCDNCGSKINGNEKFCGSCGKKVIFPKKKKKKKIIIILIISLIFIIFFTIIVRSLSSTSFTCDEGTLIGDECYSCPNGYNLNLKTKECEKILTEEEKKQQNENTIKNYKEKCETFNYEEIFRYAEEYNGKYAKFTGEVIQVQDNSYSDVKLYTLRIDVTKTKYGYEDTIYVTYFPMENTTRILEKDIVTVYGTLTGLETYESVLGSQITIPSLFSSYIEIEN